MHPLRTAHIFCFSYGGSDLTQAPGVNKCLRHLGCSDRPQRNTDNCAAHGPSRHRTKTACPHRIRSGEATRRAASWGSWHRVLLLPAKPTQARAQGARGGHVQLATQQEVQAGGCTARPVAPGEPTTRGSCGKKAWKSCRMFRFKNASRRGTEARQECSPQGFSNTLVSYFPFYRE